MTCSRFLIVNIFNYNVPDQCKYYLLISLQDPEASLFLSVLNMILFLVIVQQIIIMCQYNVILVITVSFLYLQDPEESLFCIRELSMTHFFSVLVTMFNYNFPNQCTDFFLVSQMLAYYRVCMFVLTGS